MIPELWTKVMEKYPKLPKERTCRLEREMRNEARKCYYEKLLKLNNNDTEIQKEAGSN